ncbi:DNA polymerase III subunit beta [Kitasatospora sp. NPDC059646]|uniref:DNA polymerase III subunit beta n=1 Tax=Kitasatospora sp. NPDC059646 TaxID=3346893 RepID=UPI003689E717
MKLRLFAAPFADAVAHVARALPARPPVPVLAGILLATGENGLTLSAFDYETCATVTTDAEIADDGRALVSGRLLGDIAKALPKSAEVDLELAGTRLLVAAGSAKFELPLLPLDEYPALPAAPDTVFTAPADAFADAVAQVVVAAGTDDTLPVLTGVLLTLADDGRLTLAATDRYRFAVRETDVRPTGTVPAETTVLVPAKWICDAAKALTGEHPLHAGWHDGQFTLSVPGGRAIGTRLLTGEFPKYRSLFPSAADATMTLTVPVAETIAALKRVALVVDDKRPVRLTHQDGRLLLAAGDDDGASAADHVSCNASGGVAAVEGCDVAIKPSYLIDALQALTEPEARLHLTHPHKPVLALGWTGDGVEPDYEHLLMPIRLGSTSTAAS